MCKTCASFSARRPLDPQPGDVEDTETLLRHDLALMEKRAEQAEQEIEHLRTVLATTTRQRDEADKRAPRYNYVVNQGQVYQHVDDIKPRPLTPEDITEDALDRAQEVWEQADPSEDVRVTLRRMLRALTAPTRPEGAEEIETLLGDGQAAQNWHDDNATLADFLASRGVRVERGER